MQVPFLFPAGWKNVRIPWLFAGLFVVCSQSARPDFWSLKDSRPETVKLVRKMPPVAVRNGITVRLITEIPGTTVPPETATILRDKIRTLLLAAKAGGIQLVDGAADTTIKCIFTGYEPKLVRPGERKVGVKHEQIVTWIGNIEASVQVLDNNGGPIDAANVKHHLENDFVVAEREDKVGSVTDKKTSLRDKVANGIKIARGGDKGDVVSLAGGGQQVHDALSADDKGAQPPSDLKWRDDLIEGLAAKVANRIVSVDQEFVAVLPVDKEFAQIRELAKSDRWGDVQEQTEKMSPMSGAKEAFRLYTVGLSYEALAYRGAAPPAEATESLNKASKFYDDARKLDPQEREFLLAQIRAQDSLDHYLEIQHGLESRPVISPPAPSGADPNLKAADNAALIEMTRANMPEDVMVTFVQTTPDPKFDVSANGLLELARAKVPAKVIQALQMRMVSPAPNRSPAPAANN